VPRKGPGVATMGQEPFSETLHRCYFEGVSANYHRAAGGRYAPKEKPTREGCLALLAQTHQGRRWAVRPSAAGRNFDHQGNRAGCRCDSGTGRSPALRHDKPRALPYNRPRLVMVGCERDVDNARRQYGGADRRGRHGRRCCRRWISVRVATVARHRHGCALHVQQPGQSLAS
jgi:hypothetical protein